MQSTTPIATLENALCIWEDLMLYQLAYHKICTAVGEKPQIENITPALNSFVFRDELLRLHRTPREDLPNIIDKYASSETISILGALGYLPIDIIYWTVGSRRVYTLDKELMYVLNTTSLGNVTWNDIAWPFASFALAFEEPVIDAQGNSFDFVLVSRLSADRAGLRIQICMYSSSLNNHRPATKKERSRLFELLTDFKNKGAQGAKFIKAISLFAKHRVDKVAELGDIAATTHVTRTDLSEPVSQALGRMSDELLVKNSSPSSAFFDMVARIIFGFCFYLKSLTPEDSHRSEWDPVKSGSPDPKTITNSAYVCHVRSKFTIPKKQKSNLRKTLDARNPRELCAHMRCAHWRRRPGTGHDPNAPKVIHVKASRIRFDRLQDNQLAGGGHGVVKKK